MHLIISLLVSAWTLYVGLTVSHTFWDSFVLLFWLAWPLYLTNILINFRQPDADYPFWRLKSRYDCLLTGAYFPLVLGIIYFNIKLTLNSSNGAVSFAENAIFVGIFSVVLWGITGVSVFLFYLLSKVLLKDPVSTNKQSINDQSEGQ